MLAVINLAHYTGVSTVRTTSCTILTEKGRCNFCSTFRSTLRSCVSREQNNTTDTTVANSHATFSTLTPAEKDTRLKNLHHSLKLSRLRTKYLEDKVAKLIDNQSLQLHESDSNDVISLFSNVKHIVEDNFPIDSPQRIFWEQQAKYNSLKDKRQMRWHPLALRY